MEDGQTGVLGAHAQWNAMMNLGQGQGPVQIRRLCMMGTTVSETVYRVNFVTSHIV